MQLFHGLPLDAYRYPPLKIWFGGNETWPSPSAAERLVNAIKNAGGMAEFRLVDVTGHEICYGVNSKINK